MAEFDSWMSYWRFADAVRHKKRYIYSEEVRKFLNVIAETSEAREQTLDKGEVVWRAQIGCVQPDLEDADDGEDEDGLTFSLHPEPYGPERMKPLREGAREGRVNPKGIPCLYVASTRSTAVAEVRPWVAASISLGEFCLARDIRAINCSILHNVMEHFPFYLEEPSAAEKERSVWSHIDQAFSWPIQDDDRTANYAPTQVLAELFSTLGYEAIIYKSRLGSGLNIALFDLDAAKLRRCELIDVTEVSYSMSSPSKWYQLGTPR